jgi:hypothetical protein
MIDPEEKALRGNGNAIQLVLNSSVRSVTAVVVQVVTRPALLVNGKLSLSHATLTRHPNVSNQSMGQ